MTNQNHTTTEIVLSVVDNEPRIDSRLIAKELGVEHKATLQVVDKYVDKFQKFGVVPFQMDKPTSPAGGRPERFCLFNENQSYLMMALARNSEQAVDLKVRLVVAFDDCRKRQASPAELTREQILVMALESERERLRLAQELEAAKPMIEFHEEVSQAKDEYLIAEACNILFNGSVTEKELRHWMKVNNWIDKRPNVRKATKWAVDRGFMRTRLDKSNNRFFPAPVITSHGLVHLRHLKRENELFVSAIPQVKRMKQPEYRV